MSTSPQTVSLSSLNQTPCVSARAQETVILDNVSMEYPIPKRYVDYLIRPLETRYFTALRNVSLRISRGTCLGLLGPNGAGKTTLLKLIGGLIFPSEGSIRVDGCDTHNQNQQVREKVGFVLNEERSFYWRLTGRQNLKFFGMLEDLPRNVLRSRVSQLLGFVGLADAADRRVSNYSCGMRQRLAIARGLLKDPEVLILDEPTKSLDPLGAEELRSLIMRKIRDKDNRTLIVATHQIAEAEAMCDEVCILNKGRIAGGILWDASVADRLGLAGYYRAVVAGSPRC